MFGVGPMEMVMIGIVGILVFGNRLPGAMRSLGQSVVQFKKGLRETQDDLQKAVDDEPANPPQAGPAATPPTSPNNLTK